MHVPAQLLLSFPGLLDLASATGPESNKCKAYPGTPNWPSAQVWASLNKSLDGRLITPSPPGAVCHPGQATYNETQCAEVVKGWSTYDWHTKSPVSVMWDQYTNDTCLPDPRAPCSPQGYPAYVVNASTAEHVKAGVDFARRHNVRLVVKSTGHDYLGRSIAPGALSIWTHYLNNIEYHTGQFKLNGSGKAITGDAVTVGGGTEMYDIYSATDKHKRTIVGGGGKTVGISGYISGGGHSILAPRFGLAADQVLEMQVVTPRGEILTVNEDRHADLFWALRGGGGSTFGVITSITLKTHPTPKIFAINWMAIIQPNSTNFSNIITYLVSQVPSLMDAGLSGYSFVGYQVPKPVPIPGLPDTINGMFGHAILQDADSEDAVDQILKPLNETLKKKWPGEAGLYNSVVPYKSFLAWFDDYYDQQTAGNSSYLVSRLLDKKTLTTTSPELTKALMAPIPYTNSYAVFMVGGKGVNDAKPRGGGNAVHPAWRNAYVHATRLDAIEILQRAFQPLRDLTPESGSYINEALPFEKNFQQTFWGSNYERLLELKRKVDPTDVFWCLPCVGNERWQEGEDGKLCKVK
ncbi:FAD-linked oxidoreductase ZEB1 [Metarhizium anisopliae]